MKGNWPWSVNKRTAIKYTLGYLVAAIVVGWLVISSGAEGSFFVLLVALIPAALYGWRWRYLSNRDKQNAVRSRLQVAEEYAPRVQQPQNRLYVPKDR
jgi:membrane protein implicated in regulation of membrane protease activity